MANLSNTDWGNSPTKTGLYKVTIDYSYIDPDSNWWVTPSCTYCAFTDKEKARQFAINKIKEEGWDLPQINDFEFVEQNERKDSDELESISITVEEIEILD
jgi:hypothetical protein